MSAEILKGYRFRKGNRQRLIESVFALWKFSWLENGQLLAKKGKDHYLFLLSFLSEPEAERFEENFSQDEAGRDRRCRQLRMPSPKGRVSAPRPVSIHVVGVGATLRPATSARPPLPSPIRLGREEPPIAGPLALTPPPPGRFALARGQTAGSPSRDPAQS